MDSQTPTRISPLESAFFIIPIVFGMGLGSAFGDSSSDVLFDRYAILGSFVGVLCGGALWYFLKEKSTTFKIGGLVGMIVVFLGMLVIVAQKPLTDEQLVQQDWEEYHIGLLKFENPVPLQKLSKTELSEDLARGFAYLETYIDQTDNPDRVTMVQNLFLHSRQDSLPLEQMYLKGLTGLLSSQNINTHSLRLYHTFDSGDEFESAFAVEIDGKEALGYGVLGHRDSLVTTIFLIPRKRGFSEAYIESFATRWWMPLAE